LSGRRPTAVVLVAGQLGAADDVPVHLVGAIGQANVRALVYIAPAASTARARGTVDLDRLVDDLAHATGTIA